MTTKTATTQIAKPTRYYYARSWLYGKGVTTDGPKGSVVPACNYVRFATRAARDAYCEGGSDYRTERDYREPVQASDLDLQRTIRHALATGGERELGWMLDPESAGR